MTKDLEKNRDFVAATTGAIHWGVTIDSNATTREAVTDELFTILEELYEGFGEFITPVTINFDLGTVPVDSTAAEVITEFEKVRDVELTQLEGVSIQDLRDTIATVDPPEDEISHIRDVYITDSRVRMRLRNGDIDVDRTAENVYKFWNGGEVHDEAPPKGPLTIRINHQSIGGSDSESGEPDTEYSVLCGTRSDIWIGDSEIAQVNRQRLAEVLSHIPDSFDVIDTRFSVDDLGVSLHDRELLADLVEADVEVP
jgi:hypothetical protein